MPSRRTVSRRNHWLTVPIVALAILRLVSASVTTGEMLRLGTFSKFKHEIRWVFTTGLALSTSVDILITASLFALLHTSRTGAANLNAVIDSLIRYAFETGSLTCAGTVVSMICWLATPNNLIFMGLHFVIGKLYANSLLVTVCISISEPFAIESWTIFIGTRWPCVRRSRTRPQCVQVFAGVARRCDHAYLQTPTFAVRLSCANSFGISLRLNTRERIRHARSQGSGEHGAPVHILDSRRRQTSSSDQLGIDYSPQDSKKHTKSQIELEVNVERSVQYD